MLLGVSPLGITQRPPVFKPWLDSRCIALWDFSLGTVGSTVINTIVANRITVARSLKNASDTLVLATDGTVPATQGALINAATIGGKVAARFDAVTTAYQNTTITVPTINGTQAQFWYALVRGNASASGSNTIFSSGHGSFQQPWTQLGFLGAGITGVGTGSTNTVTTGYTQGTAKRMVQSMKGVAGDYMQWGAAQTTGAFGGSVARSGFTIGARADLVANTYCGCDIYMVGLYSGLPTTGNLITKIEAYYQGVVEAASPGAWAGLIA